MSVNVTWNGTVYPIPVQGDPNWAPPLTRYLVAIAAGQLTLTGGAFTLLADVNFGPNYGLFSKYFTSIGANPSHTGVLRLDKTDGVGWRNNANSGDLLLTIDGTDQINFNGVPLANTAVLTQNNIYVGNASNQPGNVAMSGDATIVSAGTLTIAAGAIVDSKVNASAAIALSKLATVTAYDWITSTSGGVLQGTAVTPSQAVATDSNGLPIASSTTASELGYVHGVTSAIQTQINAISSSLSGYLPLTGGTLTGGLTGTTINLSGLATLTGIANTGNATVSGILGVQSTGGFSTGAVIQSGAGQNRFTQWSCAMTLAPGSGSGHGIGDYSTWNGISGTAYASIETQAETTGSTNYDHIAGFQANNSHASSGTLNTLYGFVSVPVNNGGLVTNLYSYQSDPIATHTVSNLYHFYAKNEATSLVSTNNIGLYVEALTAGSQVYGVYVAGTANPSYFAGGVYVNETPPASAIMSAASTTQGFLPPRMTTTQKNAISSPAEGLMVYDLTAHAPYYYNGSAWIAF